MSAAAEEAASGARQAKLEANMEACRHPLPSAPSAWWYGDNHAMQREKLDVMRAEFMRLEATTSKRIAELDTALGAARERVRSRAALDGSPAPRAMLASMTRDAHAQLANYEDLETALDSAVMHAAGADAAGAANASLALDTMTDSVPTAAKRRAKQSIVLAQRLVAAQRDLAALRYAVVRI